MCHIQKLLERAWQTYGCTCVYLQHTSLYAYRIVNDRKTYDIYYDCVLVSLYLNASYLFTPVLFGKTNLLRVIIISLGLLLCHVCLHPIIQSCQEAGCSVNVQTSAAFDCNAALMNFFRYLDRCEKILP